METIRQRALRTYNDATNHGMQDTPMNWHIWKRAFDIAESELKKMRVTDVSGSVCNHPLPYRLAKSDVNYECTLCGKFI